MEDKVRILSYQNAQNYGAVLQAYGLQQVIKNLGFEDVKFINYNPDYLKNRYLVFYEQWYRPKVWSVKNALHYYINLPFKIASRVIKNNAFNKSRARLLSQTEQHYRCLDDFVNVSCDYLVLGSDQIWSTWITGGPDPVFYGKGMYKGLKKRISYAPSSELSTFNNLDNIKIIGEYLSNIDCISVREKPVCKLLEEKLGISSKVCVDPTILSGRTHFDQIASERKIKKDYILVYAYNNYSDFIQSLIKTVPEYEKYEIHYIAFGTSGIKALFDRKCHNESSVEEFVSLFKYASYVVTNSFHGLAFSLLFNRKFTIAYEEGKSSRCESLLQQIDASDKMVHQTSEVNWRKFDFSHINEKLETIREDSKQFLINSLKSV